MVVLIVEGPDLSGKSYAIEKIGKYFNNGLILKNTYKPNKSGDTEIYHRYWKILNLLEFGWASPKTDVHVLDRFFPSQAVYSIMRGEDEMYSTNIAQLDSYCSLRDYLYVYLDTPMSELEKRYDSRGDEHIQKQTLKTLKKRYDEFYKYTKMKKIKVSTLEDKVNNNWLEKIKNEVDKIEGRLE